MTLWDTIRAQREISLSQACIFAVQAVVCTLAAVSLYAWTGQSGGMWAAVSAVLVLQPGVERSLAASIVRVLANLLGAGIGVTVSLAFPHHLTAVCIALAALILICELLRLDMGLRSACASLLIVTLTPDPDLLHRGIERAVAVSAGCAIALVLQLALHFVRTHRRIGTLDDGE